VPSGEGVEPTLDPRVVEALDVVEDVAEQLGRTEMVSRLALLLRRQGRSPRIGDILSPFIGRVRAELPTSPA
jgi:hypothetical protein